MRLVPTDYAKVAYAVLPYIEELKWVKKVCKELERLSKDKRFMNQWLNKYLNFKERYKKLKMFKDELYDEVKDFIKTDKFNSTSAVMMIASVQRRYRIGFIRALYILKSLLDDGIITDKSIDKIYQYHMLTRKQSV